MGMGDAAHDVDISSQLTSCSVRCGTWKADGFILLGAALSWRGVCVLGFRVAEVAVAVPEDAIPLDGVAG